MFINMYNLKCNYSQRDEVMKYCPPILKKNEITIPLFILNLTYSIMN